MQSQHMGFGIRGFYRWGSYAITAGMNNDIAQHRLRVLEFWEKHGLAAALDYSGKSRRTLYNWQHAYQAEGVSGLAPQSRAPRGANPPSQRLST